MSQFEYLSVFVSIVLGLGVAHLLSGVARLIHNRNRWRLDPLHGLWTLVTFYVLVLNWWVFFQASAIPEWTFGAFIVVVSWAVLFYLLAVVLYPPDMGDREDYGAVFEGNRRWFLGLWVASSVADILLTDLRGDLFDPPEYLPFVGHFIVLGLLALVIRSRRFQIFVAGWVLFIGLAWALGVRRLLVG
ncbi:MAG: hypothetical protein D6701_02325 [Gemmatimonadetes bacterium]|nr:MAG: hypothetical protein D6701_02325 [Gemmatimonadota bacterium]